MSLSGVVLDLISIAITVAILIFIGLVLVWFMSWLGFPVPANVQKAFMVIVALYVLYMFAALAFGLPSYGMFRPALH